jgi:uncharacterized protein YkwD
MVLAAAVVAALLGVRPAWSAPAVKLIAADAIEHPIEQQVSDLRRSAHLARPRHSEELTQAAEWHAATLARSGTFGHHAPGEKSFSLRLQSFYSARGFVRWATGENVFWATSDVSPAQVVGAWLASPPHKANIYDPLWREVGVAAVRVPRAPGVYEGRDVTIVVIEFGRRKR